MERRCVQYAVEPAYNNEDFLLSDAVRPVQILAEYLYLPSDSSTSGRFTISSWCSARIRSAEQFQYEYSVLKKHLE